MGTALTGSTVSSTYDSLLKVTDNGPLGATAKVITDGMGNDSCLKLGTAGAEFTEPLTIDGQIVFPATQNASADANTLDDYEEGTWTPSVGGDATYTTQVGRYTKIGRQVTATLQLEIDVLGTGSETTVTGLPANAGAASFGCVSYWALTPANYVFLSCYVSGGNLMFNGATAATASLSGDVSVFADDAQIWATITYFV